jgi:hypothetical protein
VRLPGELIRDAALVAGGLLNPEIGGPSVYPPLPPGAMDLGFSEASKWWPESKGRERYRRGVYIHYQRSVPYPQLVNFDQPNAAQSCPRRERSNTPLQALNLLNDPILLECATGLANRAMQNSSASFEERLRYIFQVSLSRSPSSSEAARLHDYYDQRRELLRQDPKAAEQIFPSQALGTDPIESAAWVGISRVLLNLDEFITRE